MAEMFDSFVQPSHWRIEVSLHRFHDTEVGPGAGTQIRTADLLITNQSLCLTELFRQT